MSIQAVSNVSFGATTKNGNEYKKSHAGTIGGTVVGAAIGGLAIKSANSPKLKKALAPALIEMRNNFIASGKTKAEALKLIKKTMKASVIAGAAGWTLVGLGIGALINKSINKNKAEKADEAAETPKA